MAAAKELADQYKRLSEEFKVEAEERKAENKVLSDKLADALRMMEAYKAAVETRLATVESKTSAAGPSAAPATRPFLDGLELWPKFPNTAFGAPTSAEEREKFLMKGTKIENLCPGGSINLSELEKLLTGIHNFAKVQGKLPYELPLDHASIGSVKQMALRLEMSEPGTVMEYLTVFREIIKTSGETVESAVKKITSYKPMSVGGAITTVSGSLGAIRGVFCEMRQRLMMCNEVSLKNTNTPSTVTNALIGQYSKLLPVELRDRTLKLMGVNTRTTMLINFTYIELEKKVIEAAKAMWSEYTAGSLLIDNETAAGTSEDTGKPQRKRSGKDKPSASGAGDSPPADDGKETQSKSAVKKKAASSTATDKDTCRNCNTSGHYVKDCKEPCKWGKGCTRKGCALDHPGRAK
jgi:hypothetical protein